MSTTGMTAGEGGGTMTKELVESIGCAQLLPISVACVYMCMCAYVR